MYLQSIHLTRLLSRLITVKSLQSEWRITELFSAECGASLNSSRVATAELNVYPYIIPAESPLHSSVGFQTCSLVRSSHYAHAGPGSRAAVHHNKYSWQYFNFHTIGYFHTSPPRARGNTGIMGLDGVWLSREQRDTSSPLQIREIGFRKLFYQHQHTAVHSSTLPHCICCISTRWEDRRCCIYFAAQVFTVVQRLMLFHFISIITMRSKGVNEFSRKNCRNIWIRR